MFLHAFTFFPRNYQEQLLKINEIWQNCPQLSYVVVLDESDQSNDERIMNFTDFMALEIDYQKENKSSFEDLSKIAVPDDLLTLIYTSGTTGKPKGVMIEHIGIASYLEHQKILFEDYIFDCATSKITLFEKLPFR